MASPHSNWVTSFLDDTLLDDAAQPNAFFWCPLNEQGDDLSLDTEFCNADAKEKGCSKKRVLDEPYGGISSKAFREKLRRDRINDRFLELSTILEPNGPLRTDKVVILSDTLRTLNQLKSEAQQLRENNEKLRESIKELKMEKHELRDEKHGLKSLKDDLEQRMKLVAVPARYAPHPAAVHAALTPFGKKDTSFPGYPTMSMGMWQWMPATALDTSEDHILRPPVA